MEENRPALPELFDLSSKVALVTGSRAGLGRAMATGRQGGTSRQWVADLLQIDALPGHIDDLLAETRAGILVNNADTFIRQSALELTFERWREVQTVNTDVA